MNKTNEIQISRLFTNIPKLLSPLFNKYSYPWEVIHDIKNFIKELTEHGIEEYSEISPGVFIGEGVKIDECVKIIPPAIIGRNTELRHGAYLRGNVIIGDGCVIGNSTEVKNSVIMNGAACPHYNYVGDSLIGAGAHLGAGVICSNLKSDKTNVTVNGNKKYHTGLKKLGAIIGDNAEIGCGCVLNPGTVIGKLTSVYPLNSVRGVIPSECIVKSSSDIIKKTKNQPQSH